MFGTFLKIVPIKNKIYRVFVKNVTNSKEMSTDEYKAKKSYKLGASDQQFLKYQNVKDFVFAVFVCIFGTA